MAMANLNQKALKRALKEALAETLEEQRDLFHEVFAEVLEHPYLELAQWPRGTHST